MSEPRWPTEAPIELLRAADAEMEALAAACDDAFGGLLGLSVLGDAFRAAWQQIRPRPTCDCPLDPHHRWNCPLTPLWAQTMRDRDTNPWTVMDSMAALPPPLKLTGTTERFIEFTASRRAERTQP